MLINNFIDINNIANINILVCYNKLFCKRGILYNYGSYFLMTIIFFHLIFIIIFYLKNIYKKIEDILNEITFGINNFYLLSCTKEKMSNGKIIKNKKTIKIRKKILIKTKKKLNNKKLNINQETRNDKYNLPKKKINIDETNNINLLDLKKEENEKININKNKYKNNVNKLKTKSKNTKIYNKVENIMKFNDEELNDLDYEKALKVDKRNYCQFYISLLKTKHDFLFTFFNNNDYNSKIVKIDLILFNYVLEFTINAFFFSDETMHKIYEDKGSFNFLYHTLN